MALASALPVGSMALTSATLPVGSMALASATGASACGFDSKPRDEPRSLVENLSVGNLSKRRKKFERDEQRELLRKVETLLPPAWTSHATRNCAGRRSMGLAGRSELDVLLDLQRYLRHLRENSTRKCRSDEDEVAKQSAPRAVLGVARETLLDAGNMLVLELDMGLEMDVPRCRVCAAGRAAERILVFAPSESCLGRNLGQLVHAEDFVPFIAAWRRASSRAGQTPPAQQNPPGHAHPPASLS